MLKPKVLILTNEQDVTADLVVRELRGRDIEFWRLNTERLSGYRYHHDTTPDEVHTVIGYRNRQADLRSVRGIWHRRPIPPEFESSLFLNQHERVVFEEQWRAVTWGLLALPAHWINRPEREAAAEAKLLQLKTAGIAGMIAPRTLCTNERDAAISFLKATPAVVKALHAPFIEDPACPRFVYTQHATTDLLQQMATLEPVPIVLQALIEPKIDVRVVQVGGRSFGARPARDLLGVDWRQSDPGCPFESIPVPDDVRSACSAYLQHLGLTYGAFDFAVDEDDRWWFLECNPNGEWGWIQRTCHHPIAEAIVDELIRDR